LDAIWNFVKTYPNCFKLSQMVDLMDISVTATFLLSLLDKEYNFMLNEFGKYWPQKEIFSDFISFKITFFVYQSHWNVGVTQKSMSFTTGESFRPFGLVLTEVQNCMHFRLKSVQLLLKIFKNDTFKHWKNVLFFNGSSPNWTCDI
jgi:hypothetical protein